MVILTIANDFLKLQIPALMLLNEIMRIGLKNPFLEKTDSFRLFKLKLVYGHRKTTIVKCKNAIFKCLIIRIFLQVALRFFAELMTHGEEGGWLIAEKAVAPAIIQHLRHSVREENV